MNDEDPPPADPGRNRMSNTRIKDCGGGISGVMDNFDVNALRITGTPKPIDLTSATNSTFKNVEIIAKEDLRKEKKPRKYFAGWRPSQKHG